MNLFTYITPFVVFCGLILSIVSILYSRHQNKRRIDVNLELNVDAIRIYDEPCNSKLELSAFNSGFRAVAIINYKLFVNDELIDFNIFDSTFESLPNHFDIISPKCEKRLPHVLKEGEMILTTILASDLAKILKRKRLSGEVTLLGYYETAEKKVYRGAPLKFNIDQWDMC